MPFVLFLTIWLGFNLIFGALSAYLASRWGRDPFGWLLIGAVVGPIALIVLVVEHRRDPSLSRPRLKGPGSEVRTDGQSVLVAVDGSEMSNQAVQYVIDHFGASLDEVALMSVLPIDRAEGVEIEEESPRQRLLEEDIERHLESALSELRDAGVRSRSIVRFGDPASEIIEQAREMDCSLIVMGRRGLGKASKLLLGSVSEKVTQEAPCPVTVVG